MDDELGEEQAADEQDEPFFEPLSFGNDGDLVSDDLDGDVEIEADEILEPEVEEEPDNTPSPQPFPSEAHEGASALASGSPAAFGLGGFGEITPPAQIARSNSRASSAAASDDFKRNQGNHAPGQGLPSREGSIRFPMDNAHPPLGRPPSQLSRDSREGPRMHADGPLHPLGLEGISRKNSLSRVMDGQQRSASGHSTPRKTDLEQSPAGNAVRRKTLSPGDFQHMATQTFNHAMTVGPVIKHITQRYTGVKHAGWLHKLIGKTPAESKWKRYWFYLIGDRLYYALDQRKDSSKTQDASKVRYIPLDRLPVRPLPHRRLKAQPSSKMSPDIGLGLVNSKLLSTSNPTFAKKGCTFGLVAGSHVYFLAANSPAEAEVWLRHLRESWTHSFKHPLRGPMGIDLEAQLSLVSRVTAENEELKHSISELKMNSMQGESNYWRRWLEERAKSHAIEQQLGRLKVYHVEVETGKCKGANTDARVLIEMLGEGDVSSGALHLTDRLAGETKPFQRGAVDLFEVTCVGIGDPAFLRVWHDNTGHYPDWFLEKIRIRMVGTKLWITFPCQRWLSATLDDCRFNRLLVAGSPNVTIPYHVETLTSDLRGAGTDANVYIIMHGEHGDSRRLFLSSGHDDFERGMVNKFTVEEEDLGELFQVTVGHDNSGNGASWHLDHIRITNSASGKSYLFPCRQWFDTRLGDGKIERVLDARDDHGKMVEYTFEVVTGKARNAGTDADVYVVLHGELGSSPQTTLPSNPEHFERSQTDAFRLTLPHVGKILTLTIGHNNMGASPDWFLEMVAVRDEESGQVVFFQADCWLGLKEPATQLEVTLVGSAQDPRDRFAEYKLEFHTSNLRGSGTDANVFFQLCGDAKDSEVYRLVSPHEAFERGAIDSFSYTMTYLGPLHYLRLQHDNAGLNPAWHLEKVVVTCSKEPRPTIFYCNQWLRSEDPTLYPAVELLPNIPPLGTTHFKFEVKTSEDRGAGTTSNVFVELHGRGATTGPLHLDDTLVFQKSQEDTFVVEALDIKQVEELIISIDYSGLQPGWRADWIQVTRMPEESEPDAPVFFSLREWFNPEQGLVKLLKPSRRSKDGLSNKVPYEVKVHTSDIKGASTDSNIFINIIGDRGETGSTPLLANHDTFERGQEDSFTLSLPDVGRLTAIQMRSDGSSPKPNWHLDFVCIEKLNLAPAYFIASMWLDPTNGLEIQIPVTWSDPRQNRAQYVVTMITSDVKSAGTDAGIAIEIVGSLATSGRQQLVDHGKDTFERGETDTFPIKCQILGTIKALRITHDNKGTPWHMELAIVTADNGETYYFPYFNWLGGKQPAIEIKASVRDPRQVRKVYKLRTHTSDLKGAETTATVYVDIRGKAASSGKQVLHGEVLQPFQRGKVDEFVIKSSDLGQLVDLVIGHDNKGSNGSWHLEMVEVEDVETKQVWFFECHQWLDKEHKSLERILKASLQDPRTSRTSYRLVTRTTNKPGAGTDANVHVILKGNIGNSGKVILRAPSGKNPFEKGQEDEFTLGPFKPLGELMELTIGHDNSGPGPGWHLEQVEVTDLSLNKTWFFPCNSWLDRKEGDGQIERILKATSKDPRTARVDFQVVTHTSDVRGAGTDANVFIIIHGEEGINTGPLKLDKPGNQFERNQVDDFKLVNILDVGRVKKIRIGHDNSGPGPGWHLKMVELTNLKTGQKQVFHCNKWFSKSDDDFQIERDLFPEGSPEAMSAANTYEITVLTSDIKGAGTDANVSVMLFGAKGEAGPLRLDNPKNNFEKGMLDKFTVTAPDVGDLERLKLWHDNSGLGSAWHCEMVIVLNKADGKTWFFYCGQWLDKKNGLEKMLVASPTDPRLNLLDYDVAVYTSDIKGAGTDANVFVEIRGSKGSSGPQELKGKGNNFEKGNTDHFTLKLMDLGDLTELEVWHDGFGFGAGWHLDYIEVTNPATLKTVYFNCGRWLDKKEDDGLTRRILPASDLDPSKTRAKWRVTVHTGDVFGAGTDANVHINIFGKDGSTGNINLDNPGRNDFERNNYDAFEFTTPAIGPIQKVRIGHDNGGIGAAWHLDTVQVENLTTGENAMFQCNQWFDKKKGDGLIERELYPAGGIVGGINWKMVVVTADVSGAGTDADVFIELHGEKDKFGPFTLQAQNKAFERAQRDTFSISTPELGTIKQLVIGHNNKGIGAAWCLDKVELENMSTGDKYVFEADNRWMDSKKGLSVTLTPSTVHLGEVQNPEKPGEPRICDYRFDVTTGSGPNGNLTAGDMVVDLFGNHGTTGRHVAMLPAEGFLESETMLAIVPAAPDTGTIEQLELGVANTTVPWLVNKVLVTNKATGVRAKFVVERLLEPNTPYLFDATPPLMCEYVLEVKTTDICLAGTSAKVTFTLTGVEGDTGKQALSADGRARKPFRRGAMDVFELSGLLDVGVMTTLEIGHDGSGLAAGWHLSWVQVHNKTTGMKALFPCNLWLDVKEGDGRTTRTLYAEGQQLSAGAAPSPLKAGFTGLDHMIPGPVVGLPGYRVTIVTANVCGAGTSSRVYFELIGVNGSSGVVEIPPAGGRFARGARDDLIFPRLPYLGDLLQMRIGTDGQGVWASWCLRQVEVTHIPTLTHWIFHCHGFVDRKCSFQRVLMASKI